MLKSFAKFSGKDLCWNLFFNEVAGRRQWTLYTVNKLKYMAFHKPHVLQITIEGTIIAQTLLSLSNEISLILITRFLGNEWWNNGKKLLAVRFWSTEQKKISRQVAKQKKKKKQDNYKAFCVRKSNKKSQQFCHLFELYI